MREWLFAACLLFFSLPLHAARLVVMDVGEGQALFLQQGQEAILIDTGHAGMARRVLDRLHHYGVTSLHDIILTHLHPDHASGWFRIHEAFPQAPVLENGQAIPPGAPDMVRWVAADLRADPQRRVISAGDALHWQRLRIDVLWPQKVSGNDLNYNSLVLLVRLGQTRLLIMGDAPQSVERHLLQMGDLPKQIDVLVVGHHGAADSSSKAFLSYLKPRISVISVNAGNLRAYPDSATVERLKAYSGHVYRTDRDGEVCLTLASHQHGLKPCH